ncbi:MAG: PadR family transcriptional regulator [Chloroflexi bacterium]|nr:PadR family transcriptional regulator [Chloroflexota bacterium]
MSFLQPCLLVMLHRNAAHGYSLLNGLDEFGFDLNQLDPSLVYRALRDMEMAGLVVSEWGEDSLGPQRRIYRITPLGEHHLAEWIEDLRRMRQEIEAVENAYQRTDRHSSPRGDASS